MARKRYTTEQIIGVLREAEVKLSQGETVGVICRGLGISEQSYYRWRRDYGGLKLDQAKKLKDLERENERLKKAVSELTLDKLILKEALEGTAGQRSKNTKPFPQASVRGSRALANHGLRTSHLPCCWAVAHNATTPT